jgi:hypothetical protein
MSDLKHWRREWGFLLLAWLIALPLFTPRLYAADETKYFVHLRSMWFDGDVDFSNEYAHFIEADPETWGWLRGLQDNPSPTGRRLNDAPIGAAVLWAPFYVAADGLVIAARAVGSEVPRDGYSWPYVWAVCVGSLFWGSLGLALCYLSARRFYGRVASQLAVLALWFAGSLIFYLYITPPMAHANSMFAVALFLWLWLRDRGPNRSVGSWALLGVAAGLMALVRELNWLMLLPMAVDEGIRLLRRLRDRRPEEIWQQVPGYLAFCAVLVVVVAPQFLVYWLLHRTLGPTPFVVKKFSAFPIHAHQVLFSGFHGLFSWHPITLASVLGFFLLGRREPELAAGLATVFVAQVVVIGSYDTWWGGASFGARRFINCVPFFVLGLAALVDAVPRSRRRWAAIGVALLVVWNFGMALQYATGIVSREDPVAMTTLVRNQFTVVPRRAGGVAWRFLTDRWSFVEHAPEARR